MTQNLILHQHLFFFLCLIGFHLWKITYALVCCKLSAKWQEENSNKTI